MRDCIRLACRCGPVARMPSDGGKLANVGLPIVFEHAGCALIQRSARDMPTSRTCSLLREGRIVDRLRRLPCRTRRRITPVCVRSRGAISVDTATAGRTRTGRILRMGDAAPTSALLDTFANGSTTLRFARQFSSTTRRAFTASALTHVQIPLAWSIDTQTGAACHCRLEKRDGVAIVTLDPSARERTHARALRRDRRSVRRRARQGKWMCIARCCHQRRPPRILRRSRSRRVPARNARGRRRARRSCGCDVFIGLSLRDSGELPRSTVSRGTGAGSVFARYRLRHTHCIKLWLRFGYTGK